MSLLDFPLISVPFGEVSSVDVPLVSYPRVALVVFGALPIAFQRIPGNTNLMVKS